MHEDSLIVADAGQHYRLKKGRNMMKSSFSTVFLI